MVGSYFHNGSGLGNQLFRFVASKVVAEDKGFQHGMVNPNNFKGASFMKLPLEFGMNVDSKWSYWVEKEVRDAKGTDIRSYDPEFNFIQDNTIIDGEFQDERYWNHKLDNVRKWLTVEPLNMPEDLCVIGFRGGEYSIFPDLFLTKEYWDKAISMMIQKYPEMRFEVHTDDPETARKFFPIYPITHDIGLNWRSVRYAKHLIIANSSFFIFPALLNEDAKEIIAPRYWARRSANPPVWAQPQNYYSRFTYI